MQGGRKEIGLTEVGKKGEGRALPVRVDEITISPAADAALAKLRGLFLQAVSLPMCWLCVSRRHARTAQSRYTCFVLVPFTMLPPPPPPPPPPAPPPSPPPLPQHRRRCAWHHL